MDFSSQYSKNKNKQMNLKNKNSKYLSTQVKRDTNEGNKLGKNKI